MMPARYIILLVLLYIGFVPYPVYSQSADSLRFDYDAAMNAAIGYARQNQYHEARILCRRILEERPDYLDARLLLGNTYGWQNEFDEARRIYLQIFEYDNANRPGLQALANLELWAQKPSAALAVCKDALFYYPGDQDFLLLESKAHIQKGDLKAARMSLLNILDQDRSNEAARQLYIQIKEGISFHEDTLSDPDREIVYELIHIDSLLFRAKNFAWNEEYEKSREITSVILQRKPDFFQALVLNAYTFAWDNDFANARRELWKFHPFREKNKEGIKAAIDIEKWDKRFEQAIIYCREAMVLFPDDDYYVMAASEIYTMNKDFVNAKRVLFSRLSRGDYSPEILIAYSNLMNLSSESERNRFERTVSDSLFLVYKIENVMIEAQELAYDGYYTEALEKCDYILSLYPDFYTAKMLRGNVLSWMGQYRRALEIYEILLKETFDSYELLVAMIDVNTWQGTYDRGLELADYALNIFAGDSELLYRRALLYQRLGQREIAQREFRLLLESYPNDKRIRDAYYSARGLLPLNGVSAEYTFNGFEQPFSRFWHMYTARYYRSDDNLSLVGSANIGYVTNDTLSFMEQGGIQFEIDAWPVFTLQKMYMHFNLGISPSPVFARFRMGSHVYKELPGDFELSGGFNYMYYVNPSDTTHVLITDAGIAKFFGSWMGGLSVSFAPVEGTLSQGYTAYLRRMFNRADNWMQISVGTGIYPDNPIYYLNDPAYNPTRMLNSLNLLIAARYHFAPKWIGRVYAGFLFEEYLANQVRRNPTLNVGLIYLFKEN